MSSQSLWLLRSYCHSDSDAAGQIQTTPTTTIAVPPFLRGAIKPRDSQTDKGGTDSPAPQQGVE